MINRLIMSRWIIISGIFGVRGTKNVVWWGNQGILGVGNRHDNNQRAISYVLRTTARFTLDPPPR